MWVDLKKENTQELYIPNFFFKVMDNPEKLATLGTQNTRRRITKQKTQQYVWTALYASKHK